MPPCFRLHQIQAHLHVVTAPQDAQMCSSRLPGGQGGGEGGAGSQWNYFVVVAVYEPKGRKSVGGCLYGWIVRVGVCMGGL